MIETLKKLFHNMKGEVTIPIFRTFAELPDSTNIVVLNYWRVHYVLYTDANTYTAIAATDGKGKPRQFFFRAIVVNDFGDVVNSVSANTLHELMHKIYKLEKTLHPNLIKMKIVMEANMPEYEEALLPPVDNWT